MVASVATELGAGWAALHRGAWGDARSRFAAVLARAEHAEAYEGLAWTAWWLNDIDAVFWRTG